MEDRARTLRYLGDWHREGKREGGGGKGRQSAGGKALKQKHPVKDRLVEVLHSPLSNNWLAALCSGDIYKCNYRHRPIPVWHLNSIFVSQKVATTFTAGTV